MPEWSIGPHSKCGVRVTVPGVRIPLSPRRTNRSEGWFFFLIRGKVQEWLNWPAWKASKPLKGFRGSNPLLSASRQGESPRTEVRGLFLFGTRPESVGRHPQPRPIAIRVISGHSDRRSRAENSRFFRIVRSTHRTDDFMPPPFRTVPPVEKCSRSPTGRFFRQPQCRRAGDRGRPHAGTHRARRPAIRRRSAP